MQQLKNVVHAIAALVAFAAIQANCYAISSSVALDPKAKELIHISTRPRSARSVFVDVKIEHHNYRNPDVRLKLSGIRLNVMRRTDDGKYEAIVSTRLDTWRKDGHVHAYFAIDPKLIESSTLDLVLDAPELVGENYHPVELKDFVNSALLIAGTTAVAAEPTTRPQITGKWKLTEFGDDHSKSVRPGKITAIPTGAGYTFVLGEFVVPGEERGSTRHTLPKGVHFRLSPAHIHNETAILDVLLAHTKLNTLKDKGFSASSQQIDGRYVAKFGKPFTVTLRLPDSKMRYELELVVSKE